MPGIHLDEKGVEETEQGSSCSTYKVVDCSVNSKFKSLTASFKYKVGSKNGYWSYFYLYIHRFRGDDKCISSYPNTIENIVQKLGAYFSKLNPDRLLALGFRIESNASLYYFPYDSLQKLTLKYPPFLKIEEESLNNLLTNVDQRVDKKLTFKVGTSENKCIRRIPKSGEAPLYVGIYNEFKKITYFANTDKKYSGSENGPWELYQIRLFTTGSKKISDSFLNDVKDEQFHNVIVYYPSSENLPLLVEFVQDWNRKKYLVRRDKNGHFWETTTIIYKDETSLERELSNIYYESRNKDLIVYSLEKTDSYNTVTVTEQKDNPEKGFDRYTHRVTDGNKKSVIIYNGKKLTNKGQTTGIGELDEKDWDSITVYFSNRINVPLLIELTEKGQAEKKYYVHKRCDKHSYLELFTDKVTGTKGILLKELEFNFTDSLVILLGSKNTYNNLDILTATKNKEINLTRIGTLKVRSATGNFECLSRQGYIVYEQDLTHVTKNGGNHGLRLFIPNNYEISNYDSKGRNKEYIYYIPGQTKVYVYFYKGDNRPLLFCYNNAAYGPNSLEEYNNKWVRVDDIKTCFCKQTTGIDTLLQSLYDITNDLNPVKIDETANDSYIIHPYELGNVSINLRKEIVGFYMKYTHTSNSGHRLGKVTYGSTPITDSSKQQISALGNDEVVVFYNKNDKNSRYPILIALKSTKDYRPYYKLSDKEGKKYTLVDASIDLNNTVIVTSTLDKIYHFIQTIITINISLKGSYRDKLIKSERLDLGGNAMINVNQKKDCGSIKYTNYLCYQHDLTKYSKLSEVNALKIRIGDGKDITLYNGSQQTSLNYAKSKNVISVFFYGRDPRPLLFSYDKNTYRPENLKRYEIKWVKDNSINSDPFNNPNLLMRLQEIKGYLNPVNIKETTQLVTSSNKEFTQIIHKYGSTQISIKIKRSEMGCYHLYYHEPEDGFTLGDVTHTIGSKIFTLGYDKSKDLSKLVVYYYKHDNDHKYPLFLEIELRSTTTVAVKEYYELSNTGGGYKWTKWSGLDSPAGADGEDDIRRSLLNKLFTPNEQFNADKIPKEEECKEKETEVSTPVTANIPTVTFGRCGIGLLFNFLRRKIRRCLPSHRDSNVLILIN